MTRARTRATALLLLSLFALGGCLGRAEDLIDDANVRVIITGARPADELMVDVAGERRAIRAADDEPIVVYLHLEAGQHDGVVWLEAAPPRCAAFSLSVGDDSGVDVASVDLREARPCNDEPDGGPHDGGHGDDAGSGADAGAEDAGSDAGPGPGEEDAGPGPHPAPVDVFLHLEQRSAVECLEPLCLQVTRVDADGVLTWVDLSAAEITGEVPPTDVDALAAATLAEAAEQLFSGTDPDCPQPRPLGLTLDELERRFVPAGEEDAVVQTIGIAGCAGVAAELSARLDFLRQLALDL